MEIKVMDDWDLYVEELESLREKMERAHDNMKEWWFHEEEDEEDE